jgi:hypothetical protein
MRRYAAAAALDRVRRACASIGCLFILDFPQQLAQFGAQLVQVQQPAPPPPLGSRACKARARSVVPRWPSCSPVRLRWLWWRQRPVFRHKVRKIFVCNTAIATVCFVLTPHRDAPGPGGGSGRSMLFSTPGVELPDVYLSESVVFLEEDPSKSNSKTYTVVLTHPPGMREDETVPIASRPRVFVVLEGRARRALEGDEGGGVESRFAKGRGVCLRKWSTDIGVAVCIA